MPAPTKSATKFSKEQFKNFSDFIATKKIMIADPSGSSRTGVAKTLIELGAKMTNISLIESYETAMETIKSVKPDILVTDYDFGKNSGLNLIQEQRLLQPDSKSLLSIILTGNTSQSAVAQAAEEDVDTFILKPYTVEVLKNSILTAALNKLFPSDYMRAIEEGKKLLFGGDPAKALEIFESAKKLNDKPSLAFFYAGQADVMKKLQDEATTEFKDGLKLNKIHYKCLVGLFDILMEQKNFPEAYDCMKRMAQYFPANPKRLSSVIRLAVMTKQVDDMERYYQIFTNMELRSPEMVKYVCAGLVVCGRYYLKSKNNSRALDLFQKTAVSSAGAPKFLREIVVSLAEFKMYNEAAAFMKRFPADATNGKDYLASQFILVAKQSAPAIVVEEGRRIIKQDIHDPLIYENLIRASVAANFKDYAENLVVDAQKRWPDEKDSFKRAFDQATEDSSKAA